MFRFLKITKHTAMMMTAAFAVTGLIIMLSISGKTQPAESKKIYSMPGAGMSRVLEGYVASNGESSVTLLQTTAVASNGGGNIYYDNEGSSVGKLVVCTSEDYAPIYLIKNDSSGVYGKIEQYGTATLVEEEEGWLKVVSGTVSGYVKTEDFAAGEEAEALEPYTYKTEATVECTELFLRDEESTDSVILCVLPYDSKHEVVSEDDGSGWVQVSVEGVGEGFVASEYVSVDTVRKNAVTVDEENIFANVIAAGIEKAAEIEENKAEAIRLAQEAAEAARLAQEAADAEEAERLAKEAEAAAQAAADAAAKADVEEATQAAEEAYESAQEAYDAYEEAVEIESTYSLRQELIDYACSFAGWLPYVSGGASLTTGADCSGFVYQIYKAFGYELPRGSNEQSYAGYSVPLSEILPGDIIVYSGHVALYVGDGLKVHAPYPGQYVTVNSMYYMTILDVRRIID